MPGRVWPRRLAVCWLALAASACWCDRLELKPRIGLAGHYSSNAWAPVSIKITNHGPSLSGRLVACPLSNQPWGVPPEQKTPFGYYSLPVHVDSGAAKTVNMNVRLGDECWAMKFIVVSPGGVLFSRVLELRPNPRGLALVLHVGKPRPQGAVPLAVSNASVTTVGIEELPSAWRSYDAIDAIILDRADLGRLTSDQADAIIGWVAGGGTAIVTMPCARMNPRSGFLGRLLGASVLGETTIANPTSLEEWFGRQRPQNILSARVLTCSVHGAEVLVEHEGIPLLMERQVVFGGAVLLAFDPSEMTYGPRGSEQQFTTAVLEKLLARRRSQYPYFPISALVRFAMRDYWESECPPTVGISLVPEEARSKGLWKGTAIYLAIFLLGMGPINYLVLWKSRKKEWILATVPVAVLVLSGLAVAFAWTMHSRTTTVTVASANFGVPGEDWLHSITFVGVLSPTASNHSLAFPDPGVAVNETTPGG